MSRSGVVVDASVSAVWLLPDETDELSEALLSATSRIDVWVPALWQIEICNLLASAQRRRRITEVKRRELVSAAAGLRLRVDREPVSMPELDALAGTYGLSAYDAVYLELALRRMLPLATTDGRLQKAAADAGVPLLGRTELDLPPSTPGE